MSQSCLNCGASEKQKPLLALRFQGEERHICPQCLPVLIHKPERLASILPGAENFGPPRHEH